MSEPTVPPVYCTRDLLTVLLADADERDPAATNRRLSTTAAGDFDDAVDLPPETPIFTHYTLGAAGESVNAVFGVDLGTPVQGGRGRFLSHPTGRLALSKTDDLAAVVVVAVPPYDRNHVAAFDRAGREREFVTVDAAPPEESVPR